ncbi:MAG: gliding motility-associated C-terminal domain-containing protein [Bacteroidia bacterium]|nr:gliding motility-associated C-terminal domain-containing protein [Bacteroidia bacterium]
MDSVVCNGENNGQVDLTVTGGNGGYTYQWDDANNSTTDSLFSVVKGYYCVIVTDMKGCIATACDSVHEPDALLITRELIGKTCPFHNDGWIDIQVNGGIQPYDYVWSTGDFEIDGNNDYLLENLFAGFYSVTVTDRNGCTTSREDIEVINYPKPIADFLADPYEESILSPFIDFSDSSISINAQLIQWDWAFGDGDISSLQHVTHEYGDTGYYPVTLIVTNEFLCTDTIIDTIRIKPESAVYIPNAFTPDGDGINDGWGVKQHGLTDFELYVYNRWGEMIFRTEDPNHLWNGRRDNVGELSPDGVYPYVILAKDHEGKAYRFIGHVTLLK